MATGLALGLGACDTGAGEGDGETSSESTHGNAAATLDMSFDGLESLGAGFVYEGWLIVDGAPVTAGRFTIDANGEPVPASIEVDAHDAEHASAYVLTIEPAEGDDPAPSDVHVLGGDWSATGADLSIDHSTALGTDFADAGGTFFLATPTSADVEDDADQGIWFLTFADASPSLDLPELPSGWAYEGWVVGDEGPITTGTFTSNTGADSDGAGPTAGPDGFPGFPGQDFIDPPMSLIGHAVVISVEPVPDDSPAPFAIKPLMNAQVQALLDHEPQNLDSIIEANTITGQVTVN